MENGNSSIDKVITNSDKIYFTYTLKKNIEYPYAGFYFNLIKNTHFMDISEYNYIHIKIESTTSKELYLYFMLHIEGFTQPNNNRNIPYLFLRHELPVALNKNDYWISINDFKTPSWWFQENGFSKHESIIKDFSKLAFLRISSSHQMTANIQDTVIISEISFHKIHDKLIMILSGIIIIYFIFAIIFYNIAGYYKNKFNKKEQIVIAYDDFNLENYQGEDIKKIVKFIAEDYKDPGLTTIKISKTCNVSQLKIPIIIKKHFNLSLPQYLNSIRLAEAKRLLKETDRQIIDISIFIGYKSVNHFNSIFKKQEGLSPLKYRELFNNIH